MTDGHETSARPHGSPPRGLARTPLSSTSTGRFGRMFRRVPVFEHDPAALVELGEAMVQELEHDGRIDKPLGADEEDENTSMMPGSELRLPAGYTYFGQFVDHDITFDPASSLTRRNDPDALVDFRTPRYDLDSLYGRGPDDQPYLYEPDGLHLALGEAVSDDSRFAGPDLQRARGARALIGDPRNDENLVVSQLQVAFLRFHNAVVDRLAGEEPALGPAGRFALAQTQVRWHYQWVVVHDFLPRLVGEDVVGDILQTDPYEAPGTHGKLVRPQLCFYRWRSEPFIPIEFSVAAYRFGHSMVRPSYLFNDRVPGLENAEAHRIPIFSTDPDPRRSLVGFRRLPRDFGFQWKYFLAHVPDAPGPHDQHLPQPSYRIDTQLARPLGHLPGTVAGAPALVAGTDVAPSLPVRNLVRGLQLALPAGQDVARAMGIVPLADADLYPDGMGLSGATVESLRGHAPLWYYTLREAELEAGGAHLGPVGGRIVAEVLIGLLAGDPTSFLGVDPGWAPTLPMRQRGRFTLSDLIALALAT
jgi:hypothetical protein